MHDVLLPTVHRLSVHVVEAATAKTLLELRPAVEVEHTAPQVAVDAGVAGHNEARRDDDSPGDRRPRTFRPGRVGDRVFMETDRRTRLEHGQQPVQAFVGVGHVAYPVGHQDPVEGQILGRHAECPGDSGGGIHGVTVDEAHAALPECRLGPGELEHSGRGVEADDFGVGIAGEEAGRGQPGPAAEIEQPHAASAVGKAQPGGRQRQVLDIAGVALDQQVVVPGHDVKVGRNFAFARAKRRR